MTSNSAVRAASAIRTNEALTLTTVALPSEEPMPQLRLEQHTQEASVSQKTAVRCVVVGAGTVGRTLAESLEATGRYHVIGFVDDQPDIARHALGAVLGSRDEIEMLIERHAIEEIFIAYAPTWQQQLAEEVVAKHPKIRVKMVPTSYESLMRMHHVESYGDIALVTLGGAGKSAREFFKRVTDFLFAVIGLALLLPVCLATALLVKATSSGPVLFTQERVGRFGKPFRMYKFRTMVRDAEIGTGPVLSVGKKDQRLTPLGRWLRLFRVDEIPQLLNVLRGDMSMVGPRPERPVFVERFNRDIPFYNKRHDVRPGITGLAQVHGGYHTSAKDKLRFDLIYVAHHSFWFDVSLLLRTLIVCLLPQRQRFERNHASTR